MTFASCLRDGLIDDAAIAALLPSLNGDLIDAGLADPAQAAPAAIAAGLCQHSSPALIKALDQRDLPGRCAAWAAGQSSAADTIFPSIAGGSLDAREHGYRALATLAAHGQDLAAITAGITACIQDEIARAQAGKTGLGEHACRVLSIIGDEQCSELIDAVSSADPYTDRYELQRQLKQVKDYGSDKESQSELSADWTEQFADFIAPPLAAEPEPVDEPTAAPETAPAPSDQASPAPADGEAESPEDAEQAPGIDWDGFLASEQFNALGANAQQLITQLGPMLEQLADQGMGCALGALNSKQFMMMILQILPQMVPPQAVQAALSPEAINGYQAVAKWLLASGVVENDELQQGVTLIRETMREQIRSSGMLGGPDYSDPDDAAEQDSSEDEG